MNPQPHDAGKDIYQLALFGENELNIKAFLTKSALELFNVDRQLSSHKILREFYPVS